MFEYYLLAYAVDLMMCYTGYLIIEEIKGG